MSGAVLDEETAWRLVRAVRDTARAAAPPRRVQLEGFPDVWLEVRPGGEWEASEPTTPEAQQLFDIFLPIAIKPDIVIGQLGQSLDGRIATESGESHYITGPEDRKRLHRLRALVDAVVVGAGTVAHDDPQLTVRLVEGENPVRVVWDPKGRLAPDRKVFTDGAAETLWVVEVGVGGCTHADSPSCEVVRSAASEGGFDPAELVQLLQDRGVARVLVEGGGVTVSSFLEAGLLDRLHVAVAPLLMGSGRPAITLPAVDSLDEAIRSRCEHYALGDDLLFDLDLR